MGFSKQCTKCGRVKWWHQFWRHPNGRLSLMSACKVCIRKYKVYYENKEKKRTREKIWREENREYCRVYRKKTIEKGRQYGQIQRHTLSDHYIKNIFATNLGIKYKDVPPELIEMKRQQLKLKRAIKAAKEAVNDFRPRGRGDPQTKAAA